MKFTSTDEFKLKVSNQSVDTCHQQYTKTVKKEIQNEKLNFTEGVANAFLQGFGRLKVEIGKNQALKTTKGVETILK